MYYVITEKTLTFVVNGKTYMCHSSDSDFHRLKNALKQNENEEEIMRIYYSKFIEKAKDLLQQ